jgi:hypothetical protein
MLQRLPYTLEQVYLCGMTITGGLSGRSNSDEKPISWQPCPPVSGIGMPTTTVIVAATSGEVRTTTSRNMMVSETVQLCSSMHAVSV